MCASVEKEPKFTKSALGEILKDRLRRGLLFKEENIKFGIYHCFDGDRSVHEKNTFDHQREEDELFKNPDLLFFINGSKTTHFRAPVSLTPMIEKAIICSLY